MLSYLVQRLLLMIPTFFGITLIAFSIIHLAPGDPAELRAGGGLAAGGEGGAEFDDGCWRVMSIEFLTLEKRGKRYQRGCSRLQ